MQSLDIEQLAFLIATARAFETEDLIAKRDPVVHRADDGVIDIAESLHEDGVAYGLRSFIDALSEEQQVELVALVWVGRDKDGTIQWSDVLAQAQAAHTSHTADYLLGIPLLAEFIEEGLSTIDPGCFAAVEKRVASHTGA